MSVIIRKTEFNVLQLYPSFMLSDSIICSMVIFYLCAMQEVYESVCQLSHSDQANFALLTPGHEWLWHNQGLNSQSPDNRLSYLLHRLGAKHIFCNALPNPIWCPFSLIYIASLHSHLHKDSGVLRLLNSTQVRYKFRCYCIWF